MLIVVFICVPFLPTYSISLCITFNLGADVTAVHTLCCLLAKHMSWNEFLDTRNRPTHVTYPLPEYLFATELHQNFVNIPNFVELRVFLKISESHIS